MRNFLYTLYIGINILFLPGCDSAQKNIDNQKVVATLVPTYAKGFEIQTLADSSRRIILFNLEKAGDTLQLITWRPRKIERVACLSTTNIAMLQMLGRLDDLKGVGFADLVQSPEPKARIEEGKIKNISTGHDVDAEIIYSLAPQLFFVYPFGGNDYQKYLSRGIGCVQVSEYLETTPLGRAEWIKVFGVLMDEEEKADSIFRTIENKYLGLKNEVTGKTTERPTVFTGFYDSGNWFAPPGNSFAAQFINDAGAHYIFSDSLSSQNIVLPFEILFQQAYETDYWGKIVFEPGALTLARIGEDDPRLAQIKSFRNGNIFYCNAAETDYHGDAVMQPEVILADLVSIFHQELLPDHKPVYFLKIKQVER